MGSIRNSATGETRLLEPQYLIGRVNNCALRLEDKYISAQHALLRWAGDRWRLKDLGSRNGTFLNGVRLVAGNDYEVPNGASLAFGKVLEQCWCLVDDHPPRPMVVPLDGASPIMIESDLLALPSASRPTATLYRQVDGGWMLEHEEHSSPIKSMQVFEVDGRSYRFSANEQSGMTSLATNALELSIAQSEFSFEVSRDEEYVHLEVLCAGRTIDTGSRGHNYLLLTLARRRLEEANAARDDESAGWLSYDDLANDPTMAPAALHIHIYRIRKQFARLGFTDAAHVIERRPRVGQLRLGTSRIRIRRQ